MRSFHYPAARLEAGLALDRLGFLATGAYVGGVSELLHKITYWVVIVALVQAEMLGLIPR